MEGQVFDAYLGPVAGAYVNVWVELEDGSVYPTGARADSLGRFKTPVVPDARVTVLAVNEATSFRRGFYQQCAIVGIDTRSGPIDVELTAASTLDSLSPPAPRSAKGGALQGAIFGTSGGSRQPISGAEVWAETGANVGLARSRSDFQGNFYLCNLPAGTVLHVSKPGYLPTTLSIDPTQSSNVDVELQPLAATPGGRMTVVGYVTSSGNGNFAVDGIAVRTTTRTIFEGGTFVGAGADIKLEVDGTFNSSGVLEASRLRFSRVNPNRIAAIVDSVDAAAASFRMLGMTVRIDASTRLRDRSSASSASFDISSIVPGDYVDVRGAEPVPGSGEVLATLIERRDPLAETEIRGYVRPFQPRPSNPEFPILGVRITTDAATNFRLGDDVIIGEATWDFDLGVGAFVRARGRAVGEREILATDVWYVNCTCLD